MFYEVIKRGWEARLKLLGLNGRRLCSLNKNISYNTWKQTKNPTIGWCADVEKAIQELEAGQKSNA